MPAEVTIVLGAMFGDEGKGKLVDILCEEADICARSQGGNNAGHTIKHGNTTFACHLLPSGMVRDRTVNLIGSGVVVNVPALFKELDDFTAKGVSYTNRMHVSSRCHIVLRLHQVIDAAEEEALGDKKVGTTGKGIGPTYASKASRKGVRVHELVDDWAAFEAHYRRLLALCTKQYGDSLFKQRGDAPAYDPEKELEELKGLVPRLRPLVVDAVAWLDEQQKVDGKKILVEGANALLLDLDYGTYPYVTSSNASLGGVFTGLAVSPFLVKKIYGVVKAYTTRVGNGPFPTELEDEMGEHLRAKGGEFGTTTGRPRRCGWLDLVILKHSVKANHYTSINLTKNDVLDEVKEIKVCTHYKLPNGETTDIMPADAELLGKCEPVYETFPGWCKDTSSCTTWESLPENARKYVEYIEGKLGVKIESIGCGPARENMVFR